MCHHRRFLLLKVFCCVFQFDSFSSNQKKKKENFFYFLLFFNFSSFQKRKKKKKLFYFVQFFIALQSIFMVDCIRCFGQNRMRMMLLSISLYVIWCFIYRGAHPSAAHIIQNQLSIYYFCVRWTSLSLLGSSKANNGTEVEAFKYVEKPNKAI